MAVEELIIAGEMASMAALGTLIYLHHQSKGEEMIRTFWLAGICLVLFYSFSVLWEGLVWGGAADSLSYTGIVIQALSIGFLLIMLLAFFHFLQLIWTWFAGSLRKLMGDRMR
jgi:hypothetical protein